MTGVQTCALPIFAPAPVVSANINTSQKPVEQAVVSINNANTLANISTQKQNTPAPVQVTTPARTVQIQPVVNINVIKKSVIKTRV